MSFSARVKQEIMNRRFEKNCCRQAHCFGAACFSYAFLPTGLEMHTESAELAEYFVACYAGQQLPLCRSQWWSHGRELACLSADSAGLPRLAAFYAAAVQSCVPGAQNRKEECASCAGAWLAGAFLAGGTLSDPEKEYHLEFILPRASLAAPLCDRLSALGIEGHRTHKNGSDVVYLRASEQIEDLLTAMGAVHCAMEIMNEKIYKDYRNKANRITNCETANIDKIVAANAKVLEAIRQLQQTGALRILPEALQQAAAARLAEPDISLAELAAMMQPPVSKSGLSHRLRKIVDIARQQTNKEGSKSENDRGCE